MYAIIGLERPYEEFVGVFSFRVKYNFFVLQNTCCDSTRMNTVLI